MLKILVNHNNGYGNIKLINFGNKIEYPETLVNVINNFAITTNSIPNLHSFKITITGTFNVINVNKLASPIIIVLKITLLKNTLFTVNLKNIELEYCIKEEEAIRKLCYELYHIFYR